MVRKSIYGCGRAAQRQLELSLQQARYEATHARRQQPNCTRLDDRRFSVDDVREVGREVGRQAQAVHSRHALERDAQPVQLRPHGLQALGAAVEIDEEKSASARYQHHDKTQRGVGGPKQLRGLTLHDFGKTYQVASEKRNRLQCNRCSFTSERLSRRRRAP